MNPARLTVLILSSDPAFSREVTDAWPAGAEVPDFVVLKEDLCPELRRDTYDLAVADARSRAQRETLSQALSLAGKPAILIHSGPAMERTGNSGSILALSRESECWPMLTGLLAVEILRRSQAEMRAREAERDRDTAEAQATLGRYMVEMRHTTTNAITSILGNAELLMHEPGLPAAVVSEADTIRNMALRLHEVFQRFSSIEKELNVLARESSKETGRARGASGS